MLMDDNLIHIINEAIEADQGDSFRAALKDILPKMADVYRQEFAQKQNEKSMPKVRISGIGTECARKMWYNYRGAIMGEMLEARLIRLFNRGHMEEARILAMLVAVGAEVIYQDGGHEDLQYKYGELQGTCDGKANKVPGYLETVMLEFKTMGKSPFARYMKEGLRLFSQEYFAQVQVYLGTQKLGKCLFIPVCKDNDDFNVEVIEYEPESAQHFYDRAMNIIAVDSPPPRINDSPVWWKCKFCQFHGICHGEDPMAKNCRTCTHSKRKEDGTWLCTLPGMTGQCDEDIILTEEAQYDACDSYSQMVTR